MGDGSSGSDSVQCHTDLSTCCSGAQGSHRGDWYFPNGTRLPFSGDIFERRGSERVEIRHINLGTSPAGIYRCGIPTIPVHDDDTSVRATIYLGLYTGSGGIVVFFRTEFLSKKFSFCIPQALGVICPSHSQSPFLLH